MDKLVIGMIVFIVLTLAWFNKDCQLAIIHDHFERYHPEVSYTAYEEDGFIFVELKSKVYCSMFPQGIGFPGTEIFYTD